MRVDLVHPKELDDAALTTWRGIVRTNDALRSPYFSPEFAQCVGRTRTDTRVAIIQRDAETIGFFAFQARRLGQARPLGLALSDYQGLIASPETDIDVVQLLKACRLKAFHFDHLLACQSTFAPFQSSQNRSPVMDLRKGYDAYCKARRAAGSKQILKLGTLRRKLEREQAPLRVEIACDPRLALRSVMEWKSRQCLESGGIDIFDHAWTRELMEHLLAIDTPTFAGTLSGLWLEDRLIAAHLGMRSDRVWHYWFPGYEHEFAKFSPGLLLLLEMAEACESMGLQEIDLGKGEAPYKERLASGEIPISEGLVEVPGMTKTITGMWRNFDAWAQRTPWARPATIPGRLARRIQRQRKFA